MIYRSAFLGLLLMGLLLFASTRVRKVASLDWELRENSGLAFCGGSMVYFINDGGNEPKLYRYDTAQKDYTTYNLLNVRNGDWEDLTTDAAGNLYIGEFGNNDNTRTDLFIFKTLNPENLSSHDIMVDTIAFSFSNQYHFPPTKDRMLFDCEAMAWYQDSLYLFTKNRAKPYTKWSYMYVLPDCPGTYVAQLRDSIAFPTSIRSFGWITAADIRADSLLLLSNSRVYLGVGFGLHPLTSLDWLSYKVGFSQKESVCFGTKSDDVFLSDEFLGIGNNLYYLNLQSDKNKAEKLTLKSVDAK